MAEKKFQDVRPGDRFWCEENEYVKLKPCVKLHVGEQAVRVNCVNLGNGNVETFMDSDPVEVRS